MKKMPKEPYFPFYYRDFMVSTGEMTDAEVGKYLRYLIHQWEKGSIPNDPSMIQTIRFDSHLWETLESKFPLGDDGRRRNPRLEEIRLERDEYIEKRSAAGKVGAEARWDGKRIANANTGANNKPHGKTIASTSTSTPLSHPSPKRKQRTRRDYPAEFERLWKIHPKGGKINALKAMQKLEPSQQEIDRWVDMLVALRKTEQWTKDNGKWAKDLSSWINGGYFDEEPPKEEDPQEQIDRETTERREMHEQWKEEAVPMPEEFQEVVAELGKKLSVKNQPPKAG